MIFYGKGAKAVDLGGGMTRKILAYDGKMMMVEVSIKSGSVAPLHSHPHEQMTYVLQGEFEYEVNGEKFTLTKGDSYHTLPNNTHGIKALTDGVLLDIFTPIREDFL